MDQDQYFHGLDDVDVAFARLERVAPPERRHAGVMMAVAARARSRRRSGYALVAGRRAVLTALSFVVGQQLRLSGALEVAEVAVQNFDLFLAAPVDFLLAVGESVPWLLVAPVVLCLAAIPWATRIALTPLVRPRAAAFD